MKKITLMTAFFMLFFIKMSAQYGCETAVELTPGYTQSAITSPGTGGPEDWTTSVTTPTGMNALYFDDDVYLFKYTAGDADEEVSITIFSRSSWNGVAMFLNCDGTSLSGPIAGQGTTGANSTKTITGVAPAGQTIYIGVGQWGTPNNLDFDVVSFSAIPLVDPPLCTSVTAPADGAQNIPTNTNITWTAAAGSPTGYLVSVGTTPGGVDFLDNQEVGLVTTYALAGLEAGTTYYVTITPYNGNGEAAGCTETSFTTCGTIVPDYTEVFATTPPPCWSRASAGDVTTGPSGTGTMIWVADGFLNSGTTGAVKVNLYDLNRIGWLITPLMDLSAGNLMVSFDYAVTAWGATGPSTMGSDDFVQLLMSEDGGATWAELVTFNAESNVSNSNNTFSIAIPSTSSEAKFAFYATDGPVNDSQDYDFFIDNFIVEAIPACAKPTSISVNAAETTSQSIEINWVESVSAPANGYAYYYSTENTAPDDSEAGNGTVGAGVTTATISGLDPQTTYYFWVRALCGPGVTSEWSLTSASAKTLCAPYTDLPWTENFDSVATGTNVFPDCWAYVNTTSTWTISSGQPAHSGANSLRRTWSTDGWAFTPMMTLTAGTSYTLSYYVRTNDNNVGYDITIAVGGGQSVDAMTETLSEVVGYNAGTPWVKKTHEFVPQTTGDYSFGLHVVAPNAPNGINFDTFSVDVSPTCIEPTALALEPGTLSYDSVNIVWEESSTGAASGYEYYLSEVNEAPTEGTGATGTFPAGSLGATISDLNEQTTYYLWIRGLCSDSDASAWTSSVTFTTACAPVVPTYTQDFATFVPACWTRSGAGDVTTGPIGTANGVWVADGFRNAGTTGAIKVNLYFNNRIGWMISPLVDLSAGNMMVSFDYAATTLGGTAPVTMGSDDFVQLLMSEDGGLTWAELVTFNIDSNVSNNTQTFQATIPSTSAEAKFAFYTSDGAVNDAPDYDFFIDNFAVEPVPSCMKPSQVTLVPDTLTAYEATIGWMAPDAAPANGYEYFISTENTEPGDQVTGVTAAGVTEAALTDLAAMTTYYVWVRSVCSPTDKSAWTTVTSFTTACAAVTTNYVQDFATFPPMCWTRAGAGDVTTGPTGTGTGIWAADGFLNSGTTGAVKVNLYDLNRIGWLISPEVDLSVGTYTVSFDYAVTAWGATGPSAMGADDVVQLLMSEDGGVTWAELVTFNNESGITNALQSYSMEVPSSSPTAKFAFWATDGPVNHTQDYDFFIDNFALDVQLSVPGNELTKMNVYPNPVNDMLTVSHESNITNVSVINLLGQQLISKTVNDKEAKVDMSQLAAGTYVVKITADSLTKTVKVIKK